MESIIHNAENKNEILILFFSGKSYLSNFYICDFEIDNIKFTSTEQFFHYQKAKMFNDQSSMTKILATKDPKQQKFLGRHVKNYLDSVWADNCYVIMKKGLYSKFNQNLNLKERLLSIPNACFVEASPYDKKWGIGINVQHPNSASPSKWPGANLMGQALTEVRDMLKKDEPLTDKQDKQDKDKQQDKPKTTIKLPRRHQTKSQVSK